MKDEENTEIVHLDEVKNEVKEEPGSTAYHGDHTTKAHRKSPVERRLVLKARLLIGSLGALVLFVAYLDRNSIGNAEVLGLTKDLDLTPNQYYNVLTMFFVGYIIFMLPANILLRKISPHMLIGGTVVVFGAFVCAVGGAQNYSTVLALRILTGCAQSFVNGFTIYATVWFQRDELASIAAMYYSAATISGAFSGLIAYGVDRNLSMATTGRAPWRWLLIIDGSIAMGVGVLVWIMLPRFPDRLKKGKHWLFTAEEIDLACNRVSSYNALGARLVPSQILVALKDPKSWVYALIQAGIATGVGTVGVFLPTFVKAFGYSALQTQLFTVIPYACAFFTLIAVCIISDIVNKKGVLLVPCLSLSVIGYIILLTNASVKVKIFATCLITSGIYPSVILISTWVGVNTAGFTKRGTTWALAEVWGQSFSIMGTHIYNSPPRFIKGHSIVLVFIVLAILSATGLVLWMNYTNKKRDQIEKDFQERGEVHPHASRSLEEAFDYHVSFRYIL